MNKWINPEANSEEIAHLTQKMPVLVRMIMWTDLLLGPIFLVTLLSVPVPTIDPSIPNSVSVAGGRGAASTWMIKLKKAGLLQPLLSAAAILVLRSGRKSKVWFWYLVGKAMSLVFIIPAVLVSDFDKRSAPLVLLFWTLISGIVLFTWRWHEEENRAF